MVALAPAQTVELLTVTVGKGFITTVFDALALEQFASEIITL